MKKRQLMVNQPEVIGDPHNDNLIVLIIILIFMGITARNQLYAVGALVANLRSAVTKTAAFTATFIIVKDNRNATNSFW